MSPQARDATIKHFSMSNGFHNLMAGRLTWLFRSEYRGSHRFPCQLEGRWRCSEFDRSFSCLLNG